MPVTYSISGTVFDDSDGDGLQGGGEPGLAVRAVDWAFDNGGVWTPIAGLTTDANGNFSDSAILSGDPESFRITSSVEAPYQPTTTNPVFLTLDGANPSAVVNFGWARGRQCFRRPSSWVHQVCWVPGRGVQVTYHRGVGGAPRFACYYPGTTYQDYLRFRQQGSLGRWAWRFYRQRPYVQVPVGS